MGLSARDASRVLGIDERTVRFLLRSGQLPGEKRGNRWVIPERVIAEWKLRGSPRPNAWTRGSGAQQFFSAH